MSLCVQVQGVLRGRGAGTGRRGQGERLMQSVLWVTNSIWQDEVETSTVHCRKLR